VIESPVGLVAAEEPRSEDRGAPPAAFRKAASDPAYLNQLEQFDMQPKLTSGEDYHAYAKAQYQREAKMLQEHRVQAGMNAMDFSAFDFSGRHVFVAAVPAASTSASRRPSPAPAPGSP
jgi:hypothetical protein